MNEDNITLQTGSGFAAYSGSTLVFKPGANDVLDMTLGSQGGNSYRLVTITKIGDFSTEVSGSEYRADITASDNHGGFLSCFLCCYSCPHLFVFLAWLLPNQLQTWGLAAYPVGFLFSTYYLRLDGLFPIYYWLEDSWLLLEWA